jgi:hypothetical protein
MPRIARLRFVALAFGSTVLAAGFIAVGCSQRPAAPIVAAAPIRSAIAAESAGNEDSGRGVGYAFHIRYPELQPEWDVLGHALHDFAAQRKHEFLAARAADARADGSAYMLDLKFDIARRTTDFISVLANGDVATGGAHPAPIVASFNLRPADSKLLSIVDLFTDSDSALKALSDESRHQLEGRYEAKLREQISDAKVLAEQLKSMHEWVERDTTPKAENFGVFLVDGLDAKAIGLTLIFPPYQVAAYAEGQQQVEVPAKLFYDLLKPEYRDAFAIDTEALQRGVR